jgi:hypothetical protein
LLESAFDGFQPVERVEQLHSSLPNLLYPSTCLFGLLDGEPDPIDCDSAWYANSNSNGVGRH